jgi:hypothetical protein
MLTDTTEPLVELLEAFDLERSGTSNLMGVGAQ